jgi:hypothetical protein
MVPPQGDRTPKNAARFPLKNGAIIKSKNTFSITIHSAITMAGINIFFYRLQADI